MRLISPLTRKKEGSMRLISLLTVWEEGGLYAPHLSLFFGKKEGSMRLVALSSLLTREVYPGRCPPLLTGGIYPGVYPGIYASLYALVGVSGYASLCTLLCTRCTTRRSTLSRCTSLLFVEGERVLPAKRGLLHPENKPPSSQEPVHYGKETRHRESLCTRSPGIS